MSNKHYFSSDLSAHLGQKNIFFALGLIGKNPKKRKEREEEKTNLFSGPFDPRFLNIS